jgi:hypothetical protein
LKLFLFFLLINFSSCLQQPKKTITEVKDAVFAELSLGKESKIDFGEVVIQEEKEKVIKIKNMGDYKAEDFRISNFNEETFFKFKGEEGYPGEGGNCKSSLDIGKECTIVVYFKPLSGGKKEDKLIIFYKNGIEDQKIEIEFSAFAGNVANLQPEQFTFNLGAKEPGTLTELDININNVGELTAKNIESILKNNSKFKFKGGNYPGSGGSCGKKLKGGLNCNVVILFQTNSVGIAQDQLEFKFQNGKQEKVTTINLSALSVSIEANFILTQNYSELDYLKLTLNTSSTRQIEIKNTGYRSGVLKSFSIPNPFSIDTGLSTCEIEQTLNINETCILTIEFNPIIKNLYKEDFNFTFDSGKSIKSFSRTEFLKGQGVNPADLKLSEISYDFGIKGVNTNNFRSVVIYNQGETEGEVTSDFMNALSQSGNEFSLASTTCTNPIKLKPSKFCLLSFKYNPLVIGSYSANYSITFFDGFENQNLNYAMSGEALNLAELKYLNIEESYHLGNIWPDEEAQTPVEIFIKNEGTAQATSLMDDLIGTKFYYKSLTPTVPGSYPGVGGTCPLDGTLDPGVQCKIVITGAKKNTTDLASHYMNISYFDGLNSRILPLAQFDISILAESDIDDSVSYITGTTNTIDFFSLNQNHDFEIYFGATGSYPANIISMTYTDLTPPNNITILNNDCSVQGSIPLLVNGDETTGCKVDLRFNSSLVGNYSFKFDIVFNNGRGVNIAKTFIYTISGQELAYIKIQQTPAGNFSAVKSGLDDIKVVTFTNVGQNDATNINLIKDTLGFPSAHFTTDSVVTANPFCKDITILAPTEKCDMHIKFHPQTNGEWNAKYFIQYKNGNTFDDGDGNPLNDNYDKKQADYRPKALGETPANIAIKQDKYSYEFIDTVIGQNRSTNFTFENKGSYTTTINLSFTGTTGYTASPTTCSISAGALCSITVTFTPTTTNLPTTSPATFKADYFDGIINKTINVSLTASASPPQVPHRGWKDIYAVGDGGGNPAVVKVNWDDMNIGGYNVIKYYIYRRLAWESYDYNSPLNSGAYIITTPTFNQTTHDSSLKVVNNYLRYFIDKTAQSGKTYYYLVKPVLNGYNNIGGVDYPSLPMEAEFREVRITVPHSYMALVHRWAVNRYICNNYFSKQTNNFQNFKCTGVSGLGTVSSEFDFGKDLLVDRFELNTSNLNTPGGNPKENMGQQNAWDICAAKGYTIFDKDPLSGGMTTKAFNGRLMGLLEYHVASLWSDGLSDVDIMNKEDGNTGSLNCNNTSTIELTGANTNCVSRFGIMDLVGNAAEWLRDRMVGASGNIGVNGKLVSTDDYLDSVNLVSFAGQANFLSSYTCYSQLLGMPVPDNGLSECTGGNRLVSELPNTLTTRSRLVSPNPATSAAVAGGSYRSSDDHESSRYSVIWALPGSSYGARCSIVVPY